MSERPSSPGHLGGPAAQAIVQQEKIVQAMKNVRKILNSRPAPGMSMAAPAPATAPIDPRDPTGMRAKFIAEAASKKGGKRKNKKTRKTRKSKRSNH